MHNDEQDADELFVLACFADEGPTLRRFRPRARGRATRINKRTCHITVVVARLSDDRLEVIQNRQQAQSATGRRRAGTTAQSRRDRVERSRTRAQSLRGEPTPEGAEEHLPEETPAPTSTPWTPPRSSSTTSTRSSRSRPRSRPRRTSPRAIRRRRHRRPAVEPEAAADLPEGAVAAPDDGSVPAGYEIKGNANSHEVPRAGRALLRHHHRRGLLRHGRARRGRRLRSARRRHGREQLMGQKINPYGFRLGVTTDWKSRWFSERQYKEYLTEDWKIRQAIMQRMESAAICRIEIERTRDKVRVDVHTARPGIVIGRRGAQADELRAIITKITGNPKVQLNIVEIKSPELDAALIAQGVADQLANRIAFRRAMKRAVQNAQQRRRPRHPRAVLGSPRRRRDEPDRVVPRGSGPAAHAARRHRLRLPRGPHHQRPRRREGVALQGRHPPLQGEHRRQDRPRGGDGRRRDLRPGRRAPPGRVVRPAQAGRRRARDRSPSSRRRTRSSRSCSTKKRPSPVGPTTSTRRPTSAGRTEPC